MDKHVTDICDKCLTCQRNKRTTKKQGHLPPKTAEYNPWDNVCVDTIGPYTIKRDGQEPLMLWCLTAIDPATGWLEIFNIKTKRADLLINLLEEQLLCILDTDGTRNDLRPRYRIHERIRE